MSLSFKTLCTLLIVFIIACGGKSGKTNTVGNRDDSPQPIFDSTEVITYFNSVPRFKDNLIWARNFYRERGFKLGWFKNHELVPQATEMLKVISKAHEEGLNPAHYQVVNLDEKFKELESARKDSAKRNMLEKEIDLALSGTYFNWASDYYRGLVVPKENKEVEWDVKRNKVKLHKALMTILGERESKYEYAGFQPLHEEYARLRTALAKYRSIETAGGWGTIPTGTKLKEGQSSAAVPALRKRLAAAGLIDAAAAKDTSMAYNAALAAGVKRFQQSVGFKPDGAIGPETLRQLNVPVQDRVKQIILNMERWRWIPKSFEKDYLLVNIPEYRLHVVKGGKELAEEGMNVVVGKTMNSTPIFSDKMETVVLAPYWNVPYSIVDKELRPVLSRDAAGYLARNNMEVVNFKGQPISASSINWAGITDKEYNKFILRKKPGPKNDLGDVKFLFPNTDAIYMHDTPHDQLFSLARRDFSHGCVRLEKPLQLAEYLLQDQPGWTTDKMRSVISTGKEKHIPLKAKLPVYIVYFTAWSDDAGNVSFRDDVYKHDASLSKQYFSKL